MIYNIISKKRPKLYRTTAFENVVVQKGWNIETQKNQIQIEK